MAVRLEQIGKAYKCVLEIIDVENKDGGKYKITAKNDLGEANSTINLNLDTEEDEEEEDEGKPAFLGKPVIKQSNDFKDISFVCKLTADPKPVMQWYHKGSPLKDGGRYKYSLTLEKNVYIASLTVFQVGDVDEGDYKVIAKNSAGESFATINLNFEGKNLLSYLKNIGFLHLYT
ncbi:twitchin-like [Centruroides sculpturatus]|uniref:twitchin-like n=1 Tax=Centruroides sculpturatus TaxID=218467 RepID=UPI000C6D7C77|nr:twitchin-like [Centruroides sculpturatus]